MSKHTKRPNEARHIVKAIRKDAAPVVVTPSHIRIKACPSGTDTRFQADPGHVGDLAREWRKLRGEE